MDEDSFTSGKKFVLKPKSFERVNAPVPHEPSDSIKVEAILKQNLSSREEFSPLILDLTKKVSRRKRDFLALLAIGNGLILSVMLLLPSDPLFRTLGWSASGLYSAGLSWLVWGVMDDY